jgi:hypothetical protein
MARKPIGRIILVIVMGALIGSLTGQLIGLVLPEGVVKDFFLKSAPFEIGPTPVSIGFLGFTFGLKINFNIAGLIGVAVAIYLFRWY